MAAYAHGRIYYIYAHGHARTDVHMAHGTCGTSYLWLGVRGRPAERGQEAETRCQVPAGMRGRRKYTKRQPRDHREQPHTHAHVHKHKRAHTQTQAQAHENASQI